MEPPKKEYILLTKLKFSDATVKYPGDTIELTDEKAKIYQGAVRLKKEVIVYDNMEKIDELTKKNEELQRQLDENKELIEHGVQELSDKVDGKKKGG